MSETKKTTKEELLEIFKGGVRKHPPAVRAQGREVCPQNERGLRVLLPLARRRHVQGSGEPQGNPGNAPHDLVG